MSKNVVLTLESRFMDEYGEYANLPVFNAHGSIVGYVGGEVPESGNPCEFNRLDDEGFTFCASSAEVVRLKAENAKLRELVRDLKHCIDRYHECEGCDFNIGADCLLFVNINKRIRELGIEVDK